MVSTPRPPDPAQTAREQARMNRETAVTQYGLNATNQRTPYGNLTYNEVGRWSDGTPRFEAVQTLSPDDERALGQQREFDRLTNQLGIDQTRRLQGILSQPISLDNEAVEGRLMELGRKRLDPMFAQRSQELEADLLNRGISPGTEAYDRMRGNFDQGRNDAYNQLLLQGRGQAVQEALTARNQPINEITALMSGGQVSQPNFVGTPQTQVAPVDYAGLVQNNYNQRVGSQNALYGALGSIGGMALGGWSSGGFPLPWGRGRGGGR